MNDLKRNKHFPEKIASNLKFLNNLLPEWSRHVTIVHQTKDLRTADYTQLYDFLKYNQKESLVHKAQDAAPVEGVVFMKRCGVTVTDDELTEKELKQIEADDQAIQTILLGLPKDIYADVDNCETAQEIWLRVQQMMKGSDIGIQEKKAKLFNEWERFTSNNGELIDNLEFLNNLQPEWSRHDTIVHQTKDLHTADYTQLYNFLKYNQKEVDELKAEQLAKSQDPLALMATSNNPYNFPVLNQDQPSFNQNFMHQPMPNPEDITDTTTAMNMALTLMAKAFKLNYSTPTNNN
nr:hypothetical protein [Tanacetum cinerariifolium]